MKDLSYVEINNVNPLYFIINKINGYLILVLIHQSKYKLEKYEQIWTKITDQIRKITNKMKLIR